MPGTHHFETTVTWKGNLGTGTSAYREYSRDHIVSATGKPDIPGSSDPAFLGNKAKYNPEEMLVSALSSCHMLWYLHLCADAGIVVTAYSDRAEGTMMESSSGGRFTEVVLHPQVVVAEESMIGMANELHDKAQRMCFIANSCNFPVRHIPSCIYRG